MMDEEEIHRRGAFSPLLQHSFIILPTHRFNIIVYTELTRLLSTAKDQNRQDLILKAIHALDEQETATEEHASKLNFHGMSPSMHASLFLGENVSVHWSHCCVCTIYPLVGHQ